jgi:hypothetical protein
MLPHNAGGPGYVALLASIAAPVLPLEVVAFSATPPQLQQPSPVRLCFNARNAETAQILPGAPQPAAPNGACVTRYVAATTTFTLTVRRSGAAAQSREVQVVVTQRTAPPVVTKPPVVPPIGPKPPIVTKVPIARMAGLAGWCCTSSTFEQKSASQCASPAKWFADEAEARKQCVTIK